MLVACWLGQLTYTALVGPLPSLFRVGRFAGLQRLEDCHVGALCSHSKSVIETLIVVHRNIIACFDRQHRGHVGATVSAGTYSGKEEHTIVSE